MLNRGPNDAGTAMGAAMLFYYSPTQTKEKKVDAPTLYLDPKRTYTAEQISEICPRPRRCTRRL